MLYIVMSPDGEFYHILESDCEKLQELAEEFLQLTVDELRRNDLSKERDEYLVEYLEKHGAIEVKYKSIILAM